VNPSSVNRKCQHQHVHVCSKGESIFGLQERAPKLWSSSGENSLVYGGYPPFKIRAWICYFGLCVPDELGTNTLTYLSTKNVNDDDDDRRLEAV
jgi:hypothetical protein